MEFRMDRSRHKEIGAIFPILWCKCQLLVVQMVRNAYATNGAKANPGRQFRVRVHAPSAWTVTSRVPTGRRALPLYLPILLKSRSP